MGGWGGETGESELRRGEIEGLKVRVFERVLVIHRDTRIERATI